MPRQTGDQRDRGVKTCSRCRIEKSVDKYHVNQSSLDSLYPQCKECESEGAKRYRRTGKGRVVIRRVRLKGLYNLTEEEWDSLLKSQDGLCAICNTDKPGGKGWNVDHCHICGGVRGILCRRCNLELGVIENWVGKDWVSVMLPYYLQHEEICVRL